MEARSEESIATPCEYVDINSTYTHLYLIRNFETYMKDILFDRILLAYFFIKRILPNTNVSTVHFFWLKQTMNFNVCITFDAIKNFKKLEDVEMWVIEHSIEFLVNILEAFVVLTSGALFSAYMCSQENRIIWKHYRCRLSSHKFL